jgi:hypothetical protein
MRSVDRTSVLGALLALVIPTIGIAQRGSARPAPSPGPVATPQPSAHPMVGFGTLNRDGRDNRGGFRDGHFIEHRNPFATQFTPPRIRRFGAFGFGAPVVLQESVPVPEPDPYPVPVYYRVRVPVETPPEKPYDPTKSKMLMIGEGVDGGGGVMRIERLNDRELRLTWRGSVRPIRDAQLFLADSAQHPLVTKRVDLPNTAALFPIKDLEPRIAYLGLTIIFADGATRTNLIPYHGQTTPPE